MSKFRLLGLALLVAPAACASAQPASTPPRVAVATPPAAQPAPTSPAKAAAVEAASPASTALPAVPATPAATPTAAPPAAPVATGPDGLPQLPTAVVPPSAPVAAAPPAAPAVVHIVDETPFVAPAAHAMAPAHPAAAPAQPARTARHTKRHPAPPATAHGRQARAGHDHPDPRIIVDVTGVQGNAVQADVQRQARAKGYTVIRHCYEEGLRRNQQLGGRVAFDVVVGADGAVTDAQKKSSSLNDDSVNACILRETAHVGLFAAENAAATVSFAVTLSPGDDPIAVPHAAPHADRLRETLRTKWSGVEVCYKQGLDKKRDLGGRIEIKFKVKSSGEVLEAAEGDTRFSDVDVTRCVLGVYRNAKFARIGGRHDANFVYALHLEALPQGSAPVASAAPAPAEAEPAREEAPPARPRRRRPASRQ